MAVLISRHMLFNAKPFTGRGASLYASVGSAPGVDPGPNSIKFRRPRLIGSGRFLQGSGFTIADGVPKTTRIDHVVDPVNQFAFTAPAAWLNRIVWLQVRTHWDNVENTDNTDPYRLDLTAGGEIDPAIHATGSIVSAAKYDGGIYRLKTVFTAAHHGTQPTTLLIRKTAGTGSFADVESTIYPNQVSYQFDTEALTDADSYTFDLIATDGAIEEVLNSITFEADAAGPPAPTGLTFSVV